MAVEGNKPQESTADGHDSRESANAAGVKAERNRRYDDNDCFVCCQQGHKQWDCPESPQGRTGKASMARAMARPPYSGSSPQTVPLSIPGANQLGWHLRASATPRARGYQAGSKTVVRKTESAALEASTQNDSDYIYIRVPRENMAPVNNGLAETVQHSITFYKAPVNTMQHQFFTPS